jgi:hypothetical protein
VLKGSDKPQAWAQVHLASRTASPAPHGFARPIADVWLHVMSGSALEGGGGGQLCFWGWSVRAQRQRAEREKGRGERWAAARHARSSAQSRQPGIMQESQPDPACQARCAAFGTWELRLNEP